MTVGASRSSIEVEEQREFKMKEDEEGSWEAVLRKE
jgi:hypothetical protein